MSYPATYTADDIAPIAADMTGHFGVQSIPYIPIFIFVAIVAVIASMIYYVRRRRK